MAFAFLFRKTVLLKITSLGEDDPVSIEQAGGLRKAFFRLANFYLSPSPALIDSCRHFGMPQDKLLYLPNGVDCERFRPTGKAEKLSLRQQLGLPEDSLIVLFVGHFSQDNARQDGDQSQRASAVFRLYVHDLRVPLRALKRWSDFDRLP